MIQLWPAGACTDPLVSAMPCGLLDPRLRQCQLLNLKVAKGQGRGGGKTGGGGRLSAHA